MLRITERFTFQWDFVIYYKKLKVHCHFDPIKTNVISYHLFLEICNEYLGMPLQFLFLPSSPCTSSSNKNPFPYCLIPIWGVLTAFYDIVEFVFVQHINAICAIDNISIM